MPSGNLRAAIDQAMAICWNENYGYNMGGMARSYAEGVDCSGLVGRVLSDNGFNYPSTHVGTMYMKSYLRTAGFDIYYPTSLSDLNNKIKPGDIVVMNHLDWTGGHTFFYMEKIRAYTDYTANSANIGTVAKAKVEASSSRGETAQGDHRRNGTGAYWEVWCHAYWELVTGYSFTDSGDEIYLAHWPPGLDEGIPILVMKHIMDKNFGRKDASATILS